MSLKNGATRIRTCDPLNANQMLYQLSYNPNKLDANDVAVP